MAQEGAALVQAQLHLAHADHQPDSLMPVAAVALPVAISLAAIAWLSQVANAAVGAATWLYLGAGLALIPIPLSGQISVMAGDVVLALVVTALVIRDLLR